jgi:hypothetical protein
MAGMAQSPAITGAQLALPVLSWPFLQPTANLPEKSLPALTLFSIVASPSRNT